jgi:YidC/Oxa1 family membrane protein insertase
MIVGFPVINTLEHIARHVLNWLHFSAHLPWAWSIVALTICVRILLVPLVVRQIHSMQSLQAHAPQMKEIQRKYKGDRQKLNEELMKFYKENSINPAASCLPLLAQLPVFFALYLTLKHFSHHITGSWLSIVHLDQHATSHWSGYLLLAIYAGSQMASTYFMGTTMDKMQRNIMMVVPVFFITIIARFPTGLTLYWVTTNLWTVGQGLITRRLVPKTPAPSFGRVRAKPAASPAPAAVEKPKPAKQSQQPRTVRRKKGSK